MKKALWQYLLKPAILLYLLMQFCKLLFLLKNWNLVKNESVQDFIEVFTGSFYLDLAVLSYLLFLPSLIFYIYAFKKELEYIKPVLLVYYTIIAILYISSSFIDMELFSNWGSKISAKALSFLNTPTYAVYSAGKYRVFLLFTAILLTSYLSYRIFKTSIQSTKPEDISRRLLGIWAILSLSLLTLGLRGGIRVIPINQSEAYFSSNPVLNLAGVNSLWNFGNVLFQNTSALKKNPYKTMELALAEEIFKEIYYTEKDTSISILNTSKPNIIYIALEGVNANCIKDYNANNDYMPELSKMMNEAYSFKKMYASGMRTDQGLVAILGGFPALPVHTLGAQEDKFKKLPSLSIPLKEQNYSCNFFFGGEPEFGSIKAYLVHNGFEKIYSFKDFPQEQRTQDLGVPDEYLFEKFTKDMHNAQEPFFSLMLTQTTHEPFDMPFNNGIDDDAQKYINTVRYVDSVIGIWYENCKKEAWFENSLIIISSDHGHAYPDNYWYTDKERYHIPFILLGGALKEEFKGEINNRLCNQTDIPLSIAKQLNLVEQNFEFSKDIMNPYSPKFSSFIHINGHNWIKYEEDCSIDFNLEHQFSIDDRAKDSCAIENAAYIQTIFTRYLSY